FAKMPDPTEIKDALEGLESLYEAGKGGARMLRDALEAIETREKPTFTVKEGLKFKRAWYRALRTAESGGFASCLDGLRLTLNGIWRHGKAQLLSLRHYTGLTAFGSGKRTLIKSFSTCSPTWFPIMARNLK
ncbi:hypothetical protein BG011_003555, partial [Mortierella polycephala]